MSFTDSSGDAAATTTAVQPASAPVSAPAAASPAPAPAPAPSLIAEAEAAIPDLVASVSTGNTKSLFASRTIWALLISAVAAVAGKYGHPISAVDQTGFVTDALGLVQYASLAAAALFRVLAVKPLA